MEKDARQSVFCVVGEMLQDGMKVIAVARKQVGRRKKTTPDDEKDMTLVGYLFFFDAPKQTEGESVTALKRLKVIPKIQGTHFFRFCNFYAILFCGNFEEFL